MITINGAEKLNVEGFDVVHLCTGKGLAYADNCGSEMTLNVVNHSIVANVAPAQPLPPESELFPSPWLEQPAQVRDIWIYTDGQVEVTISDCATIMNLDNVPFTVAKTI